MELLQRTSHRPTPLPDSKWLMTQRWDHLLFMHFPVSRDLIQEHIPSPLELDTFDGEAWVSIIPFKVNAMRLRRLPKIPFFHSYLELNVRTYVKHQGVPGVYFFSLDANLLPFVLGSRALSLPYFQAKMSMSVQNGAIAYSSIRNGKTRGIFQATYRATSKPFTPATGTLTDWFLERYILWTIKGKTVLQGDIHHEKWQVSEAEVDIKKVELPPFQTGTPLYLHYALSRRVLLWPLHPIKSATSKH
ncbi:YqjF family protein [Alkalihalobacillus sp. TS-13]|uniref:YqjF family protein n=1 Tax=Alkalihalobacillus sp. TS-13 TaxID=2842455 RepID=UPI001C88BFEF|nr:DUF2071 domain-containing protein [Alkalihalobacillus sp. TS-13]